MKSNLERFVWLFVAAVSMKHFGASVRAGYPSEALAALVFISACLLAVLLPYRPEEIPVPATAPPSDESAPRSLPGEVGIAATWRPLAFATDEDLERQVIEAALAWHDVPDSWEGQEAAENALDEACEALLQRRAEKEGN